MAHCVSHKQASTGKGKNPVLPLAFCVFCCAAAFFALSPVVQSIRHGAATGGFVPVTQVSVPSNSPHTTSLSSLGGPLQEGQSLGSLSIDNASVSCTLYYGDSKSILEQGAGLYTGSHLPGQGSLTLIGGHTNTFFRNLEKVQDGDLIRLSLSYGDYVYRVTSMKVSTVDDATAYDLNAQTDQLVLYTCYPFGTLAETPYRYYVTANLVSGPALSS